jgi:hypothetical protein
MSLPNETVAILIGIEDYEISKGLPATERWDLDGPASDAVSFAKWLKERQVPAENIYVFASALKPAELTAKFDALGVKKEKIVAPTQANIEDFFLNQLPALASGDAQLFVLWGGHGVIRDGEKRHLYCSNIGPQTPRSIILEDLLRALRKADRFAKQYVFIDACANQHELTGLPIPFAHSGDPAGTLTGVQQYTLLAASAGQLAVNNRDRHSGLFSTFLFETLAPLSINPDFHAIKTEILIKFDQEISQNPTFDQRPVSITVENVTGARSEKNFGGKPVPRALQLLAEATQYSVAALQKIAASAANCPVLAKAEGRLEFYKKLGLPAPPSVADHEYDRLNLLGRIIDGDRTKEFLAELRSAETDFIAYQALSQALERAALVRDARKQLRPLEFHASEFQRIFSVVAARAPETPNVEAMLNVVAEIGPIKSSKLFEFLHRLAESPHSKYPQDLKDWVKERADPEDWATLERQAMERRSHSIVISIKPRPGADESPESFTVWLLEGGRANVKPQTAAIPSAQELIPLLENILEENLSLVTGPVSIEISVPLEMMRFQFDKLGRKKKFSKIKQLFARDYPLFLRWRDRPLDPALLSRWRSAADRIRQRLAGNLPKWVPLSSAPNEEYLLSLQNEPPDFIFFGAPTPPVKNDDPDWLHEVIVNGAPFGAWTIKNPADPSTVPTLIDAVLIAGPFEELPVRTRKIRVDPTYKDLQSMVLLWDDPRQCHSVLLEEPV